MTITQIVAASTNNVIGKNYQLLWNLPNDMKHFKNKTWALPVVMGRKTFFSLDSKPLNGRLNVVITNQIDFVVDGVKVVGDIDAAIAFCKQEQYNEIMIIGGGQIYQQTLPITNKIYLTRVHTVIEGDTTYPKLNLNEWYLSFEEYFDADSKHAFAYSFQTWKRK